MFNFSGDDKHSTQLEGKKLKNRGAYMEGQLLEVDKDVPALREEQEIEEGQEYFADRELGKEKIKERGERLKRETEAARQEHLQLQKQHQEQLLETFRSPNKHLGQIEQGMLQSRNKGHKTVSTEFKQHNQPADEMVAQRHSQHRKPDMPIVSALLGEKNAASMQEASQDKHEQTKDKSIPAQLLPDTRGDAKAQTLGF